MSLRDLVPWKWGRSGNRKQTHAQNTAVALFRQNMDNLIEAFFGNEKSPMSLFDSEELFPASLNPKIDVTETPEAVEVTAELPGLDEKDIDISVTDDVLRIRGEKRYEHEEKKKNVLVSERSFGMFSREIPLWTEVDKDNIDAQFRKGVLKVRLPKSTNATSSRKITVRSA